MQYAMDLTGGGFKVTEKSLKIESAKKYLEVSGDISFGWMNDGLKSISEKSKLAYLAEVGKSIQSNYKKALEAFKKQVLKLLNALEKKLIALETAFKKKHAKAPPTGKQVEAVADKVAAMRDAEMKSIETQAQKLYKDAIAPLTKAAHAAGCKKINEGAKIKKDHGKLIWTVVKIVVVATAIAVSVFATIATAGAATPLLVTVTALSAAVLKTGGLVMSAAKDLTSYFKQYRANVSIAAEEVANAHKAIDKALTAIEAANKNHEVMQLKIGQVKQEFINAISEVDKSKVNTKEIQKARSDLEKGKSEVLAFETKLGGNPSDVMAALKKGKAELLKSQPKKVPDLDSPNRWADFFKNAGDVVAAAAKASTV